MERKNNHHPYVIAGPCSVESREQLRQATEVLCRVPEVKLIRGGVWKPRTRPGGFEGLGEPALRWMQELQNSSLRMADGGPVRFCCEVARPEHVELGLHYGIEAFWMGARTTANPFMVEEICHAMRGCRLKVMVKNPVSPDVRLWLGAIERVEQAGIATVAAVHRGFNVYGSRWSTDDKKRQPGYRNDPLWEIPMELRRLRPTLPILCDPSHIGGRADLVAPLASKAMQLDYDGLMIEVHPTPPDAWTDADQQLTPDALVALLHTLPTPSADPQDNPAVEMLRRQIDDIDHEALRLLARRMKLSHQMADLKQELQMSVYQPQRWHEVMRDRLSLAASLGHNPELIKELMEKIHAESVRVQMEP